MKILERLMEGRPAAEIAALRFVSIATVRSQIRSIQTKLGVHSQLAAVCLAFHAILDHPLVERDSDTSLL